MTLSVFKPKTANEGRISDWSSDGCSSDLITGGNIEITAPGAVDLGNSIAGGFVQVSGQSIAFNAIDAGLSVDLFADGIDGGSIAAGGDIPLFADSIALPGTVQGAAHIFDLCPHRTVAVQPAREEGPGT